MIAARILGAVVLLAVVLTAHVVTTGRPVDSAADGTMALGFVLVVSFFAGRVATKLSLPSITGYLLVGVLFGPYVIAPLLGGLTVLSKQTVSELRLLDGAALGLIALTAGGELKLSVVRTKLRSLMWIISAHVLLVTTVVGAVMLGVFVAFDVLGTRSPPALFAAALLLGVSAVAKSPATTIAIIQEYQPKGPMTDVVLAVTVAKDIVVVTVFTVALAAAVTLVDPHPSGLGSLLFTLMWEVLGSIGLGVVLGWGLARYARKVGKEMPLVVLAVAFLSGGLMEAYHLSGLLACMVAGFWVENFSDRGEALIHAVEKHSLPLYIIFFTIAGAALDLEALASYWPAALALVLARAASTFFATWLGARISHEPAAVGRHAWTGFIGQAGVTLGFAAVLVQRFGELGGTLSTIVIAGVALNQLVGPVLFRLGLKAAGEVAQEQGAAP